MSHNSDDDEGSPNSRTQEHLATEGTDDVDVVDVEGELTVEQQLVRAQDMLVSLYARIDYFKEELDFQQLEAYDRFTKAEAAHIDEIVELERQMTLLQQDVREAHMQVEMERRNNVRDLGLVMKDLEYIEERNTELENRLKKAEGARVDMPAWYNEQSEMMKTAGTIHIGKDQAPGIMSLLVKAKAMCGGETSLDLPSRDKIMEDERKAMAEDRAQFLAKLEEERNARKDIADKTSRSTPEMKLVLTLYEEREKIQDERAQYDKDKEQLESLNKLNREHLTGHSQTLAELEAEKTRLAEKNAMIESLRKMLTPLQLTATMMASDAQRAMASEKSMSIMNIPSAAPQESDPVDQIALRRMKSVYGDQFRPKRPGLEAASTRGLLSPSVGMISNRNIPASASLSHVSASESTLSRPPLHKSAGSSSAGTGTARRAPGMTRSTTLRRVGAPRPTSARLLVHATEPPLPGIANVLIEAEGRVWVGCGDGSICMYDKDNARCVQTIPAISRSGVECMVSVPGGTVWTGHKDGTIRVWLAKTGELRHEIPSVHKLVTNLLVVGPNVWSIGTDLIIIVWSSKTRKQVQRLSQDRFTLCMVLHNDLVWVGTQTVIKRYNPRSMKLVDELPGHEKMVQHLLSVWTNVWSCGSDNTIRVWNTNGEMLAQIQAERVHQMVEFEENIWCASHTKSIMLFNKKTFQRVDTIEEVHTGEVSSITVSKDSAGRRRVWSGSWDKSIAVWRDSAPDIHHIDTPVLTPRQQEVLAQWPAFVKSLNAMETLPMGASVDEIASALNVLGKLFNAIVPNKLVE
eukprot:TRINITY_DN3969_c0_g1_i6.p1 TRINITY_DN3969_c0_g1~~TRINITY_DN3969_c0_g1_i6.p1  ORF type:complete len:802 (-),score=145.64 TRINITY_DN3969_c0_g1_i6:13-2418(-)